MRVRMSIAAATLAAVVAFGWNWGPATTQEKAAAATVVAIPRGKSSLAGDLHVPAAPNGFAVVLAPGQGYHRALPLMERSARALAQAGFTAVRFDWKYFTEKEQASADGQPELTDVAAAVAFARAQPGVKRVLLAGKSLGSLVAAKWAADHASELAGVAFLTLPVNEPDSPETPHSHPFGRAALSVPFEALIVCGDADPLADRRALYRLAAEAKKAPRIVIVPGDHGFGVPSKNEAEKLENVDAAVQALALWARREAAR